MPAFVRFSDLISLIGDERLWLAKRDVACDTDSVCAIHSLHTPTAFNKYAVYATFMLLLTMSVLCTSAILNDIDQSYYYCFIVLKLSYTPCHIRVCHGFV